MNPADITPWWPVAGGLLFALLTAHLLLAVFGSAATEQGHRHGAIDGLRGYLALGVYLAHGSTWFVYLRTGHWQAPPSHLYAHLSAGSVAMFFMVTGFLFFEKVLNQKLKPIHWPSLFIGRFFRLVPLYLAGVVLLLLVAFLTTGFQLNEPLPQLARRISHWLLFTIPGTQPINGLGDTVLIMVGVWSLPYEWLLYASLPLATALLRYPTSLAWLLASTAVALLIVMAMPGFDPIHLRSFAGGICAAFIARNEAIRLRLAGGIWGGVALACVALSVYWFPTYYLIGPTLLLSLAFIIIACGNSLYGALTSPLSRLLGEISYSTYLLHSFGLYVAFRLVAPETLATLTPVQHWQLILAMVPLLVLSSYASFRLIEAPALRYGRRFRR